jgi:predicted acylesterase/phospholipase RssA
MTDQRPLRVLVLQGGGALGAYQAGVCEALGRAGLEPDWLAGISIGAINCAIIAGNAGQARLDRLQEFWYLVTSQWPLGAQAHTDQFRAMLGDASIGWAVAAGVPGFFSPRTFSPLLSPGGGPEALSFYDTAPGRRFPLKPFDDRSRARTSAFIERRYMQACNRNRNSGLAPGPASVAGDLRAQPVRECGCAQPGRS